MLSGATSPTISAWVKITPNPIKGIVDEVGISTVPRSLGWMQTEHANQSSPSTFYAVGSEQLAP